MSDTVGSYRPENKFSPEVAQELHNTNLVLRMDGKIKEIKNFAQSCLVDWKSRGIDTQAIEDLALIIQKLDSI